MSNKKQLSKKSGNLLRLWLLFTGSKSITEIILVPIRGGLITACRREEGSPIAGQCRASNGEGGYSCKRAF